MRIVTTAAELPAKRVTNAELSQKMATSDAWIRQRTGIHERRIAADETTYSLALGVAQQLLAQSAYAAEDLDFILVATMSPDFQTPSEANRLQGTLGATHAFGLNLNVACAGFVYALDMAAHLLQGQARCGLVIGSEVLSRLVDWQDRTTAVLFGDGAAGVLVAADDAPLPPADLRSYGDLKLVLQAGAASGDPYFHMNGRAVYQFALKAVPASIRRVATQPCDWYLIHQANARIIEAIGKKLAIPAAKLPMNVANYGNTSAASVPLLLHDMVVSGRLKRGQRLLLCGFGGGLSIGSLMLTY
ncbi:beta-ketoacyl-ACP synthase 3 [Lacticaseibacillus baoqingensis]|uniref:Beta-ketoacyl-ACP synthase 3 n=1 Tax=Lacticaseibacillus baoqingensis TaxID=2486013 RepID=A0ABW4E6E7_9LACO|nr:beta-ketoacyl-ACP synthase 3 [Lacticaseibacillus baoqingensis]